MPGKDSGEDIVSTQPHESGAQTDPHPPVPAEDNSAETPDDAPTGEGDPAKNQTSAVPDGGETNDQPQQAKDESPEEDHPQDGEDPPADPEQPDEPNRPPQGDDMAPDKAEDDDVDEAKPQPVRPPANNNDVELIKFDLGAPATALAWSPDGNLLAAGCSDGAMRIWSVETEALVAECKGHSDSVNAIIWVFGGDQLITAGNDGKVVLWNSGDWNAEDSYVHPEGQRMNSLIPWNDRKQFFAGDHVGALFHRNARGGKVSIIDAASQAGPIKVLRGPAGEGKDVFASGHLDGTVLVWDARGRSASVLHALVPSDDELWGKLYEALKGNKVADSQLRLTPYNRTDFADFCISPDGTHLAVAARYLDIWKLQSGYCVRTHYLPGAPDKDALIYRRVRWHPSGEFLITARGDGEITVLDTDQWKARWIHQLNSNVTELAWNEGDKMKLAASGEDGRTTVVYFSETSLDTAIPPPAQLDPEAVLDEIEDYSDDGKWLGIATGVNLLGTYRLGVVEQERLDKLDAMASAAMNEEMQQLEEDSKQRNDEDIWKLADLIDYLQGIIDVSNNGDAGKKARELLESLSKKTKDTSLESDVTLPSL